MEETLGFQLTSGNSYTHLPVLPSAYDHPRVTLIQNYIEKLHTVYLHFIS